MSEINSRIDLMMGAAANPTSVVAVVVSLPMSSKLPVAAELLWADQHEQTRQGSGKRKHGVT